MEPLALTLIGIAVLLFAVQWAQSFRRLRALRAREAEVEVLQGLSVDVAAARDPEAAVERSLGALGVGSGGLWLFDEQLLSWRGPEPDPPTRWRAESLRNDPQTLAFRRDRGYDYFVPVMVDGTPAGAFVAIRTKASRNAIEIIARLVGIALEREQLLAERAHIGALEQSHALKTALLRAVSHDLTTPLTSIILDTDRLRRTSSSEEVERIARETARLRRRIENLLSMARLEAGQLTPHVEPTPPVDLFRLARENLPSLLDGRPVTVTIEDDCPDAVLDPSFALEILVNLLENAHHASPPDAPLELAARRAAGSRVRLGVLDRGQGLPGDGLTDLPSRGLGLEIARTFATAVGGTLTFEARKGGGTAAWLEAPAASEVLE
jgi:K+-sensing histidine kinase KdpD